MDVDAPVADSELGGLAARAAAGSLAAQAVCHIVFIGVLCPVMPELWRAISHQWQQQNIAQLLRQVQAGDLGQLESIHDNSMLEQTLVQAVKAPGISEKTCAL